MGSGAQPLLFTRVLLKNWRSFVRAHAEFGRRMILVGPASSGKSSLLDAFVFLRDLATPGVGLLEAVGRRGGVRRLRCLAARQDSRLGLVACAGSQPGSHQWEFGIEILPGAGECPRIYREWLHRQGEPVFERPDPEDKLDPDRLLHSCLETADLSKPVREFAQFLRSVRRVNPLPGILRKESHAYAAWDTEMGGHVLNDMATTPEKTRNSRLRKILKELRAFAPPIRQLELHFDECGRPHVRALFEHWRPRGAWQSEQELSDGVLRLIAILWEALSGSGPLLVEEPENSLHEQLVRCVPQMLHRLACREGRQVVVAAHSASLVDGPGVSLSEVLLLCPGREETLLRPALAVGEAAELLRRGSLEAGPSAPPDQRQIPLFSQLEE